MRLLSLYFALYCIALHSLYLDFVLDVLQNGVLCQRPFPKYILMGGVMMTLIGGVLSRTACGGMQLYHQTCHAYIYIYIYMYSQDFTGALCCFIEYAILPQATWEEGINLRGLFVWFVLSIETHVPSLDKSCNTKLFCLVSTSHTLRCIEYILQTPVNTSFSHAMPDTEV